MDLGMPSSRESSLENISARGGDSTVPLLPAREESLGTISGGARGLLLLFGLGLFGLLGVAAWLKPDPYGLGLGTHEQLGLPPCGFREYFGIRCPSCGMTTSWSYLVRGQVLSALASNAGGTLLGVIALLAAPWLVISALRGKWFLGIPSEPWVLAALAAFVVVTLADWAVRLLW